MLPHSNARRRGVYAHHHPPLDVLPHLNSKRRGAYAHHHPPFDMLPCLNTRQRSLCPPPSFQHAPSLERETEELMPTTLLSTCSLTQTRDGGEFMPTTLLSTCSLTQTQDGGSLCPPPPSSRHAPSLECDVEGSFGGAYAHHHPP